jgi:hypothetical protein
MIDHMTTEHKSATDHGPVSVKSEASTEPGAGHPSPDAVPDGLVGVGAPGSVLIVPADMPPAQVQTLIDAAATIRELTDQFVKIHAVLDDFFSINAVSSSYGALAAINRILGRQ